MVGDDKETPEIGDSSINEKKPPTPRTPHNLLKAHTKYNSTIMSRSSSIVSVAATRRSSDSNRSIPSPPSSVSPVINDFDFMAYSDFQEPLNLSTQRSAKSPSVPSRPSSRAPSLPSTRTSSKPSSVHTFVDDYYYPTELPPLVEEEEPEETPVENKPDDIKSQSSRGAKSIDLHLQTDILDLLCHLPRIYPKQPKQKDVERLLTDLNALQVIQDRLEKDMDATLERSFRDV
jgi:hypothetical protein